MHSTRYNDYEVEFPPSIDHFQLVIDRVASTVHPLTDYISYDNFFVAQKSFLAPIATHDEPKSFN